MAKNTSDNHRHGAVSNRSQAYNPKSGSWVKCDSNTGRFMDVKSGGGPHKERLRSAPGMNVRISGRVHLPASSTRPPAFARGPYAR